MALHVSGAASHPSCSYQRWVPEHRTTAIEPGHEDRRNDALIARLYIFAGPPQFMLSSSLKHQRASGMHVPKLWRSRNFWFLVKVSVW